MNVSQLPNADVVQGVVVEVMLVRDADADPPVGDEVWDARQAAAQNAFVPADEEEEEERELD